MNQMPSEKVSVADQTSLSVKPCYAWKARGSSSPELLKRKLLHSVVIPNRMGASGNGCRSKAGLQMRQSV